MHRTIFKDEFAHCCICTNLCTAVTQMMQHRIDDIDGVITLRENAIAAFRFERHTQFLKEVDNIGIIKSTNAAVEESSIPYHIFDNLRDIICACHVAAAFSRDHHLAADARHLFEQRYVPAVFRRRCRRHHPR